ncbi:MAG: type II toxin-antitoxin system MqsA family antitoxin, partial [Pseudomonadota bacterium]
MKCVICRHGETALGLVTVTLQREGTVVIMRDVPANVCRNCGEYYLDESVAAKVYS